MNVKKLQDWVHSHLDHFMDIVRIYLGVGLVAKGVFFLMHPETLSLPAQYSQLTPVVQFVPYVHIVGGLLLAVGLFVRLAAFVQLPILAGAVVMVNLPNMMSLVAREGFEFSALVLFLLGLVFLKGAGPLSLSAKFQKAVSPVSQYDRWVAKHPDFFLDLVRVYLGAGLLMKGLLMATHRDAFMDLMRRSSDMEIAVMMGWHYVVPVHIMGGIFLMLGMATRWSALLQLPALLGAVFCVYLPQFSSLELRQNFEFSTLVMFLLGLLSVYGAGRYSVDHQMEKQHEHDAQALQGVVH